MEDKIFIKVMEFEDIQKILEVLKEPHMIERSSYFKEYIHRCYQENVSEDRITFVAYVDDVAAGYVNIIFRSQYEHFQENNIPEINDLYVVPGNRKIGIGKQLIDTCEKNAKEQNYEYIGLGVGLYRDYGSAQRLYTKNGYILDGKGLMYNNQLVNPGTNIFVDDDLLLYLYKKL